MSVFKREGSPNYYVEFEFRNRRIVKSARTSNRREAEAFERRLRDDVRRESERIRDVNGHARTAALDYTIDQMFGRYWLEHGSKLRWAHEVAAYAKRIVAIAGEIKVADFNVTDAAYMVETLREQGTGAVAINRALAVFRGAHTMAGKRWGIATRVIDWKQLRGKEPRERIRWITREEAATLLACLPPHASLIVEFALYTGLRKAEILSLSWDMVDMGNGWFDVRVKGGHTRRVLLSDCARDVLARAPKNGRYAFDSTNLRKHFAAGLKMAEIKNFRFHDLRHTNATWMRREGISLEIIQRHLGHSSIQVTQRYAHVDDREVLAAGNKIDPLTASNVVAMTKSTKTKFVYFISDGDAVKIGRSTDPERRLRILQTGHPKTLWLVGTLPADVLTEDEAHRRFADGKLRGEWFVASAEIVRKIAMLCEGKKLHHVGNYKSA